MNDAPVRPSRWRVRKTVEQVQREAESQPFKRVLGPADLVLLGIGSIIGAGIFVLTGNAAASFAGPAVLLSFLLAGLACAFTGLCYAELAATLPAAGSAYTYSYATLGEAVAWITGWLMLLELGIAVAVVAVGFSGYAVSLLRDFGMLVPPGLATPYIDSKMTDAGLIFTAGHGFNLVAALGVLAVTALLVLGVSESAAANRVLVLIKVIVLVAFVIIGVRFVDPAHWTPFVPPHEGGFTYGWPGVLRASSIMFYAYIGFETVCTTAAECRNPRRDLPIGVLGSLAVCTCIYIAVAAVLTGVVPFRQLGIAEPIAVAVDAMNLPWFGFAVKVGAIAGLFSVMLVTTYGQTRVFYAMSRDGLLPALFSRVHEVRRTPHVGTVVLGVAIAVVAGLLPITILSDMVALGTALAFGIVCLSVIRLRNTHPHLERSFRVPWGGVRIRGSWIGVVPALGILFCILMVVPLLLDIFYKALKGDVIPALLLLGYLGSGAAIYLFYGIHNSKAGAARGEVAAVPAEVTAS